MKNLLTVADLHGFTGCLPNPLYRAPGLRDLALTSIGPFSEVRKWEDYVTCIEDQGRTGTCEAQAASMIVETLMRQNIDKDLFAPDLGLDPYAMHKGAWLATYPDRPPEQYRDTYGLPLGATLEWCRANGILPHRCRIDDVGDSAPDLWDALHDAPVEIGVTVHDGYSPDRLGEFAEVPAPVQLPPDNGHALVVTGQITGADFSRMDVFANSWGRDWGFFGFGQCLHHTLAWTFIDRPKVVRISSDDVAEWIGGRARWEPLIVRRKP
jgi:hypothetical protein